MRGCITHHHKCRGVDLLGSGMSHHRQAVTQRCTEPGAVFLGRALVLDPPWHRLMPSWDYWIVLTPALDGGTTVNPRLNKLWPTSTGCLKSIPECRRLHRFKLVPACFSGKTMKPLPLLERQLSWRPVG